MSRPLVPLAVLLIAVNLAASLFLADQQAGQDTRITKVERVEDPCVQNLRGPVCQRRTCIRLHDVGLSAPRCRAILARGVVASNGNNAPSGLPGPPPAGGGQPGTTTPPVNAETPLPVCVQTPLANVC